MTEPDRSPLPFDELHRDVLTVLALSEQHPASRTHWQERVRAAGILDGKGRALHGEVFKRIVEALDRAGAVQVTGAGAYTPSYDVDGAWMAPVLDDAARRKRIDALANGLVSTKSWGYGGVYGRPTLGLVGDLRRSLAADDKKALALALQAVAAANSSRYDRWDWVRALGIAVPPTWLERLDEPHRSDYLDRACHLAFTTATRMGDDTLAAAAMSQRPETRARAATVLALRGEVSESERVFAPAGPQGPWEKGAFAFAALTRGRWDEARKRMSSATIGSRGQRVGLPSYLAVFELLLAGSDDAAVGVAELAKHIVKDRRHLSEWPIALEALRRLAAFRMTGRATPVSTWVGGISWIDHLVAAVVEKWCDQPTKGRPLDQLQVRAMRQGYGWLAERLGEVIDSRSGASSLLSLLGRRAPWELALDAMESATRDDTPAVQGEKPKSQQGAIHWSLSLAPWGGMRVTGHFVGERAKAGKPLSIERLRTDPALPLDERDRRIVEALVTAKERHDPELPLRHLALFVEHPRVRDEEGEPISVVMREPQLRVESTPKGAKIALTPSTFDASGMAAFREGSSLVGVARTALANRLLLILGEKGLVVPNEGLSRMGEVVAKLSGSLPVHAAESLAPRHETEGDARVRVQLFRLGSGLRARLRVAPSGSSGPTFRPGAPPDEIVVATGEGLRRVRRDLAKERGHLELLLERCPMLASLPREGDDRVARELDTCLELLVELGGAEIVIEWPEGQPIRAPLIRRGENLRVRVGGTATWLEIDGELRVDEGRVVDMHELLASASRAHGRFVPIGEDEYLALTDDVRAKLASLDRAERLADKGKLSASLLPALDGWLEGFDVTWSATVSRRRAELEEAERSTPRIPRALACELRDYQRDGFTFLARRTGAGLGACLADDMGLGKTVQALALLLHRAARGPALVVAPTSVCRNWEQEAARFAPTLRMLRLDAADRKGVIQKAKERDVIVTSYGLLVSEQEALAAKRFATVVFDEAHALKNAATRRWSAARALDAEAIVALTGTPVENHAGELHAVLDVVVPSMLGSRASFDRAFGQAIAEGKRDTVGSLRQIVRPLVLRRTKAEVLSELPPKTEMTRLVEPTDDHRAFYEAVRRRAIERLGSKDKTPGARSKKGHIEMLAEITRLRRAAIDPRLVGGETAPPGAKLDALVHLVSELREEGHRALVFSQFLEVLDLAKSRLEAISVECRRLDGTMSAEARAVEVEAFQAGRGDVFLLSLKAGGSGMNLTGADFVVHLDPWWNPAVEDQATDRAHRIGQSRPVTIVRLVTAGTIEEKVLELHGAKRKLYEDVIGAADGAGVLDLDMLAELLGDGSRSARERTRVSGERPP